MTAEVVRTVALEAILQSVAVLGLLVLIHTFLSWALVVEIDGRIQYTRLTERELVLDSSAIPSWRSPVAYSLYNR